MKVTQPRLLPKTVLEPIGDGDALTFGDLATRYGCRCGHTAETGEQQGVVACVRCGAVMVPSS